MQPETSGRILRLLLGLEALLGLVVLGGLGVYTVMGPGGGASCGGSCDQWESIATTALTLAAIVGGALLAAIVVVGALGLAGAAQRARGGR
ncbi:hypothetical protein [Patulibacter defluvii]|uniref:hypothetical protein n=1 Tax=Patulibacter defluvii TaxID=3095358 RepID=UPI002A75EEF5|nr:hypothetical protein [Patulibacter sp. DM4]